MTRSVIRRICAPRSLVRARYLLTCMTACLLVSANAQATDDATAYRLFQQEQYAQAAELFSDPAWKGVALYRSQQWWRAAEAFIRASDASSLFNLGNTYVQMGYYALALESYQACLSLQADHEKAAFNAALMRKLLSENREQNEQAGLQPKSREIDRIESDEQERGGDSSQGDDPGAAQEQQQGQAEQSQQSAGDTAPQAGDQGDSDGGSDKTQPDDLGQASGGKVDGARLDDKPEDREVSGASQADDKLSDSQAAGMRARLEKEQATEQWLNGIRNRPARYLGALIEMETRRRREAGTLPESRSNAW